MAKTKFSTPKVDLDLDLMMAEVYNETRTIKVFGKVYRVPVEIPARLLLQYTRNESNLRLYDVTKEAILEEATIIDKNESLTDEEKMAAVAALEARLEALEVPSNDEIMALYKEIIDFAFGMGVFEEWTQKKGAKFSMLQMAVAGVIAREMEALMPPLTDPTASTSEATTSSSTSEPSLVTSPSSTTSD